MKMVKGGVTAAKGFMAAGIYAGIKKKRKDMALVYTKKAARGAGVFTQNIVKAAPVNWGIKVTKDSDLVHAVVINSGIANAATGQEGEDNNRIMAETVATELEIPVSSVYTASTGVIGQELPIDKIIEGIKELKDNLASDIKSGLMAADAIRTTDTFTKECAVSFMIGDKEVVIGGMSKGSGMIHPNMATLLGVITTDVSISKELLQEALSDDVKRTFNMISIDRDTSTNDSVFLLANGAAENVEITSKNEDYYNFCKALNIVTRKLSRLIASDGEGASKLIEATVEGATNEEVAIKISKSIISSNLVKTAMFGNDANWGRILCAMGYSGGDFNPDMVDLYMESEFGKLQIAEKGLARDYSEEEATKILSASEVKITIDLNEGEGKATAWGCDLSYDYVKINADYRS